MTISIPLHETGPLHLEHTLNSGQVFRWRLEPDGRWYGSIRGTALAIRSHQHTLEIETGGHPITEAEVRQFLGLDDPLPEIRSLLCARDPVLQRAFAACYGQRLVQQDPWEGLASFICSSHNALSRIQRMMVTIAKLFGEPSDVGGHRVHTFPPPETIARLSRDDLAPCRLGYRDTYLLEAARMVANGTLDLEALRSAPYEAAREALLRVPGVGPKVSDCVLLMVLGRKECAFPVDVWVRRAILRHYKDAVRAVTGVDLRPATAGLTDREYRAIVQWAQRAFAPHVGYAQAYLFLATRSGAI